MTWALGLLAQTTQAAYDSAPAASWWTLNWQWCVSIIITLGIAIGGWAWAFWLYFKQRPDHCFVLKCSYFSERYDSSTDKDRPFVMDISFANQAGPKAIKLQRPSEDGAEWSANQSLRFVSWDVYVGGCNLPHGYNVFPGDNPSEVIIGRGQTAHIRLTLRNEGGAPVMVPGDQAVQVYAKCTPRVNGKKRFVMSALLDIWG